MPVRAVCPRCKKKILMIIADNTDGTDRIVCPDCKYLYSIKSFYLQPHTSPCPFCANHKGVCDHCKGRGWFRL